MSDTQTAGETPTIADKVRFWEEQDRINQAIIPRLLKMHESLDRLSRNRELTVERMTALEAQVKVAVSDASHANAVLGDLERRIESLASRHDALPVPSDLTLPVKPQQRTVPYWFVAAASGLLIVGCVAFRHSGLLVGLVVVSFGLSAIATITALLALRKR